MRKRTLVLINLLTLCNKGEKEDIVKILNKSRSAKSSKEIKFVIDLMKKYGTIEYGKRKAREFASESKNILSNQIEPHFKSPTAAKTILELVDFVVNREY